MRRDRTCRRFRDKFEDGRVLFRKSSQVDSWEALEVLILTLDYRGTMFEADCHNLCVGNQVTAGAR